MLAGRLGRGGRGLLGGRGRSWPGEGGGELEAVADIFGDVEIAGRIGMEGDEEDRGGLLFCGGWGGSCGRLGGGGRRDEDVDPRGDPGLLGGRGGGFSPDLVNPAFGETERPEVPLTASSLVRFTGGGAGSAR